jgi:hypothetical protein
MIVIQPESPLKLRTATDDLRTIDICREPRAEVGAALQTEHPRFPKKFSDAPPGFLKPPERAEHRGVMANCVPIEDLSVNWEGTILSVPVGSRIGKFYPA